MSSNTGKEHEYEELTSGGCNLRSSIALGQIYSWPATVSAIAPMQHRYQVPDIRKIHGVASIGSSPVKQVQFMRNALCLCQ